LAGETILIIDDNADVRVLLGERVLPSYGYRTLTAPDGQEGLWQIRTHSPDLILLDLRLPDMTGLDVLHILSSEGYDTPVILITAYGSELIAAQALRLGIHDYIIKPFTLDEIVESVERALTEQRLRRERNALADRLQYYTAALRMLADVGTEVAYPEDPYLQICRLLEMSVAATRSHAARLWVHEPQDDILYLRVAQDRADQRAYLLRQRTEPPAQVQEALRSAEVQKWAEESNGVTEIALAIPILLDGQPTSVLEVYLPDETVLQDDSQIQLLRILADWAGLLLNRSHVLRQIAFLRQQFNAVANLSQDMLLVLDEKDAIVAATPAIEEMMGCRPEEVIGRDFCQWIEEVESPQGEFVDWYLQQSGEERTSARYAFSFRGRQGGAHQAEVQVLAHQEGEDVLQRYLLFHEVTARNRLEQEVRTLRRTVTEVVRGSGLGLCLTDLKGTVLAVSGELLDLLQLPQEVLLGRPLWETLDPAEGRHLLPEEIARACREGTSYMEVRWPDKGIGVLGITASLLLGADGAPHAIVVLAGPARTADTEQDAERPADEGDLLGRTGVDPDARD